MTLTAKVVVSATVDFATKNANKEDDVLVINEYYDNEDDECGDGSVAQQSKLSLETESPPTIETSRRCESSIIDVPMSIVDGNHKDGNTTGGSEEAIKLEHLLKYDYYTNDAAVDCYDGVDVESVSKDDERCCDTNNTRCGASNISDTIQDDNNENENNDDDDDDDGINVVIDELSYGAIEIDKLLMKLRDTDWSQVDNRNYVLVKLKNILIPIDTRDTILSSPMQHSIWFAPRHREPFNFVSRNHFDQQMSKLYTEANLQDHVNNECVAYFAAVYDNEVNKNFKSAARVPHNSGSNMDICVDDIGEMVERISNGKVLDCHGEPPLLYHRHHHKRNQQQRVDNKLYYFREFAVLIMQNGRFKDAAVHGVVNNISDILDVYNVSTVYVNCEVGSSLDTLLMYKYQPFYRDLHSRKLIYIRGALRSEINTLVYCFLNNIYCAFCRCINTVVKHYMIRRINMSNAHKAMNSLTEHQQQQHQHHHHNHHHHHHHHHHQTARPTKIVSQLELPLHLYPRELKPKSPWFSTRKTVANAGNDILARATVDDICTEKGTGSDGNLSAATNVASKVQKQPESNTLLVTSFAEKRHCRCNRHRQENIDGDQYLKRKNENRSNADRQKCPRRCCSCHLSCSSYHQHHRRTVEIATRVTANEYKSPQLPSVEQSRHLQQSSKHVAGRCKRGRRGGRRVRLARQQASRLKDREPKTSPLLRGMSVTSNEYTPTKHQQHPKRRSSSSLQPSLLLQTKRLCKSSAFADDLLQQH